MVFLLAALPERLVGEVRAAGGDDHLAAVRFTQHRRHHAGAAMRVRQVGQRVGLRVAERDGADAEQWGEAEHDAGVGLL